ncbi:hypothetical protein EJ110_NYTH15146 [Nymphaea thermarum]|nr:hypothetical protein EJ110_NYTH15146 [Nymphaea thermarum]
MADDFKARVDRVFGSLLQTIPSVISSSPWTLSDDDVERKEWKRDAPAEERDETPSSSCFDGFRKVRRKKFRGFEDDLSDDGDDLDEDGDDEKEEGGEDEGEDGQVRSAIGLDSTLDQEAEEDEYDKVAVGREGAGERVYMNEVNEYGPRVNYHNVLPDSLEEGRSAGGDPRANHVAARARLREDDQDVVASLNSHPSHDMTSPEKQTAEAANVKSILKRKDDGSDPKPRKRVRFDAGCNTKKEFEPHSSGTDDSGIFTTSNEAADDAELQGSRRVPDYVRNPSKYVCYTLDWSTEDDDASNLRAFQEFSETVKQTASPREESGSTMTALPKSVTFTPRKKPQNSASMVKDETGPGPQAPRPVGMAAFEAREGEACPMEEDEHETSTAEKLGGIHKVGRQYRSRASSDDSVS